VSFLLETLIFLMAALVVVPVCRRLGLSSVLGYLAAGLLIGPSGLGAIGDTGEVLHFAEIGVVATSGALALALITLFGLPLEVAVLVGFALSLSSTAFVLQLLGEQHKLNHAHGRAAFGILLMQDVAVIPALAVLTLLSPAGEAGHGSGNPDLFTLALVVAGLFVARLTLRPALRFIASTGIHELFVAAGLAIVVGSALAMQTAGLSMGLGAFIAGMLVADSEYRHQLEADVMPFKGLLLGLFFMAVGMSANLALLGEAPVAVLGLTLGLIAVKLAVALPLARWHGLSLPEAARTAAVLSQGGEFAFVFRDEKAFRQTAKDAAEELKQLFDDDSLK
jgi:Kef-type K+ transport system membrane component KefB